MKFSISCWRECLQMGVFIGLYAAFHLMYFQIPDEVLRNIIYRYGVVQVCADLVHLISPSDPVMVVENSLQSAGVNLEIVRGCDGAGALFLLIAAILAFPATFKQKISGLVLGVALLFGLNTLRITGLYYIAAYYPDYFSIIHIYFAPTLLIIVICLFFAWWAFGFALVWQ
jgi:exosortase family protein XrtM